MTLPHEAYNAIVHTGEFLHDLVVNPRRRTKQELAELARRLARHYPSEYEAAKKYDIPDWQRIKEPPR